LFPTQETKLCGEEKGDYGEDTGNNLKLGSRALDGAALEMKPCVLCSLPSVTINST
jgi:hypothetical protein